jgi:hypothetical protein
MRMLFSTSTPEINEKYRLRKNIFSTSKKIIATFLKHPPIRKQGYVIALVNNIFSFTSLLPPLRPICALSAVHCPVLTSSTKRFFKTL